MKFSVSDKFVLNLAKPSAVIESGREYLVAPITIMREQVMNGSQGPIFYPFQQIQNSVSAWNGVPLLNYHPTEPIPARNDTRTLYAQGLGFIRNAEAKEPNLHAQAWFDVLNTKRINPKILNAVKEGSKIQVSSGLYLTPEAGSGQDSNGIAYNQVATQFIPDHVAILIDAVGACSVDHGCGVNNELSHRTIRMELARLLNEQFGNTPIDYAHVIDVFDNRVIYERSEKIWELGYTKEAGDKVTLAITPVEVRKIVTFEPITNEEDRMNREQKVSWLVSNCGTCATMGAETVNALPDEKLNKLYEDANKTKTPEPVKTNNKETSEPKTEAVKNEETSKVSAQDWIKQAPEEVQTILNSAKEIVSNERKKLEDSVKTLIGTSVLNEERQQFYLNSLSDRKIADLRELEELMQSMQKKAGTTQNYEGQGPTTQDPISAIESLTENEDPTARPLELPSLL